MDDNILLRLEGIHKEYGGRGTVPVTRVLSGLSLSVSAGESISIAGPSGSGKSTLLNIMGALDKPKAGKVLFNGDDLYARDDERLSFFRNREIGFIFQMHHLLPQCSVIENVLVPTIPFPEKDQSEYRKKAEELLGYIGLGSRMDHRPGELSGGEQLRTAVVRALINDPAMLLADEPTGSLDSRTAAELGRLLVKLNREKDLALVVVTHSPEMAGMMENKYELKDGMLTGSG